MAPDIVTEHDNSAEHREAVPRAGQVGCFYCCTLYDATEIADWIDEVDGVGQTALCPRCGIDAVLPVRKGVDMEFLEAMRAHWFS